MTVEETPADLEDTVSLFVRSLRHRTTAPQLHILSPLAGTLLHFQHRDRLHFDDVLSDLVIRWARSPAISPCCTTTSKPRPSSSARSRSRLSMTWARAGSSLRGL